jgi:outer membrane receptor protein involved in Fe transport
MRIFVILFFLFVTPIIGQTITGVVKDKAGKLLVGVNVFSKKHNIGTTTNLDGEFEINRKASIDILTFSYLGFYEYNLKLISGKIDYLIQLKDTNTALQEVLVVGKTKAQKLREEAYSVIVIEAKELKNRSTDVNEILSKISGVNIRQSGGLGSETTLSINGLSENQIRIFINGVPMDYFGKSLSLNNFPANIIEQI